MNKYWTIAKVNFRRTTWIAYLVALIGVLTGVSDFITSMMIPIEEDLMISIANFLYIICLMAPIFIASINYIKMMHMGVKKKTYFYGCFINYVVFAAIVSLVNVLEYFLLDLSLSTPELPIYSLINIFGWDTNVLTAFFCQFFFLMLLQVVVHTLTFIQNKWYGIAADVLIVAIISVFTPIDVLRQTEVFFFHMILFVKPAIVQMAVCFGLTIAVYATNLFYLKRRS